MSEKITVTVTEEGGRYFQTIDASGHALQADEPGDVGGQNRGPAPYDLLLASLGACTSMTVRMYADRKQWPLTRIRITLTHHKEPDAENKKRDVISREITLEGALDDEQRARLLDIADKCPVHRTLTEGPRPLVTSTLV